MRAATGQWKPNNRRQRELWQKLLFVWIGLFLFGALCACLQSCDGGGGYGRRCFARRGTFGVPERAGRRFSDFGPPRGR